MATPFVQPPEPPLILSRRAFSGSGAEAGAEQGWTPTMAAEWWWFLVLNAIVAVIAVLSKVAPSTPRGGGITRRASSAALQRLRSSIFSFPSSGFQFHTTPAPLPQPEAAATTVISQETGEPAVAPPAKPTASTRHTPPAPAPAPSKIKPPTRVLALVPPVPSSPVPAAAEAEVEDDPDAMSMDEAYAQIVAARKRAEPEREEDARQRSDVDAKAEEFIQGFKEDLRQQRLNSIFNYTQMLKQRAFGGGRRQARPAAQPHQP